MNEYAGMTKSDLVKMLTAIKASASTHLERDQLQRLVQDLQLHQVEMEISNRELREAQMQLEQSRDRYVDLFDFSPVGYVTLNERSVIREINQVGMDMLGGTRSLHVGMSFHVYIDKSDLKKFHDHLRQCREAENPITTELRLMRKNGEGVDVEIRSMPVRDLEHENFGYRLAIIDIGNRKHTLNQLRLASAALEHCEEAVAMCDNRNFIVSVNRAFRQITGYSEKEVTGKSAQLIGVQLRDDKPSDAWWSEVVKTGHWRGEVRGRRKNGASYPQLLTVTAVRNDRGFTTHYVHIFSDLTRFASTEHTRELANYDTLTKLPSTTLLHDRLDGALAVAQRNGTEVAVLYLNADRFNVVNKELGYLAGDQFLQMVASCLRGCLRAEDTVCRYDGDEFVVVLPDVHHKRQLMHAVEKILKALQQTHVINGLEFTMTGSVGISVYPNDGRDGATLIKHAKIAMRDAKDKGRNTCRFFTRSLGVDATNCATFERQLRRALERGELTLDYQPQVAPIMNRVVGCEALVRWAHPERGVLSAEQIIPAAEECGLMDAIGEWTLRAVCAQIRSWHDAGIVVVPVSINVSSAQLCRDKFANLVDGVLGQHHLKPSYLAIELSQRSPLQYTDTAAASIRQLKTMGVQVVLDNFGGNYSSLGHLRGLPVNKLKIDKLLVQELPHDKTGRMLVRTIIDIGYNFGFTVMATGVETRAQFECLSLEGCQSMQGFYFGRPASPAEFTILLKTGVVTPVNQ
jgi:diguanylate cyclase (GGDEF)-like protein/PAS domain S-box-containing protein